MKHCRVTGRWGQVVAPAMVMLAVSACSAAATTAPRADSTGSVAPMAPRTVQLTAQGGGRPATASLSVPSSAWTLFKGFAVTDDSGGASRGVSLWKVGRVARDPCHSLGRLYDPGRTVGDLVAALEAQAGRRTSPPRVVTLAGFRATYLTWSVPTGLVVTGDADFAGCDVQPEGQRDYVSWEGSGGQGERWQQMAGQVDELWVLDVDGQRLVVDASHSPDATPVQIAEEDQIVASLSFGATP